MYVLCFISQKVDEQNSMDTLENDSAAAEHSLPNNSEVAEVQNCFFLRTLSCYFLADCARAISWTDDTNRFDLRLKWPQVDGGRLEHIRLDLTWLRSSMSTWVDFKQPETFRSCDELAWTLQVCWRLFIKCFISSVNVFCYCPFFKDVCTDGENFAILACTVFYWLDPSAAPPTCFRPAAVKFGWRAGLSRRHSVNTQINAVGGRG